MTHKDIKDKDLRKILERELLLLRILRRERGANLDGDYFYGVRVGFITALRRVQLDREIARL